MYFVSACGKGLQLAFGYTYYIYLAFSVGNLDGSKCFQAAFVAYMFICLWLLKFWVRSSICHKLFAWMFNSRALLTYLHGPGSCMVTRLSSFR